MALGVGRATTADLPDDELVARFQAGEDDALHVLLDRYRRFARAKVRGYFLAGADREDLEQEAMIGLYKAARDFRSERGASFRAFAEVCVVRQVLSAVKAAARDKHQALNGYVSISVGDGDHEGAQPAVDVLLDEHHGGDPAEEIITNERSAELGQLIGDVLSNLEVDVLRLYADGCSYSQISEHLGRHTKAIDNALQRVKRKLDVHINVLAASSPD